MESDIFGAFLDDLPTAIELMINVRPLGKKPAVIAAFLALKHHLSLSRPAGRFQVDPLMVPRMFLCKANNDLCLISYQLALGAEICFRKCRERAQRGPRYELRPHAVWSRRAAIFYKFTRFTPAQFEELYLEFEPLMFVQRTIVQNVWNRPVSDRDVCLTNLGNLAMESNKYVPPSGEKAAQDVFMRCSKLFTNKHVGTGRDRLFCVLVMMGGGVIAGEG